MVMPAGKTGKVVCLTSRVAGSVSLRSLMPAYGGIALLGNVLPDEVAGSLSLRSLMPAYDGFIHPPMASFKSDSQRRRRVFRLRGSESAGVVIRVATRDCASVSMFFRGQVLGQNDLNHDDFIVAGGTTWISILIGEREAAVLRDPTGVSFPVHQRTKFDASRLNGLTVREGNDSFGVFLGTTTT